MDSRALRSLLTCAVGALALAGCGSSSNTTSSTTPPASTTPATSTTAKSTSKSTKAGSTVKLAANPSGSLMYIQKLLTAKAGIVTIDFTNTSPTPHNVTVANSAGKVLGATPTFEGGTRTLTLSLAKGTYTYYCSVPGHEQAGMKGTLSIS